MDERHKLKQLILYVAERMQGAESFGSTKLNKVLYRADMSCYRELGRRMTSFRFQKNSHGPTLRAFVPITQEMMVEGLLRWEPRPVGAHTEQRPVALQAADLGSIQAEERERIDREIERAWSLTGRQMSEEEHRTAAWFALRTGETISPELCFVEDPGNVTPLDAREEARAHASIERFLARARA